MIEWHWAVILFFVGGCSGALVMLQLQLRDNARAIKKLEEEKARLLSEDETEEFYGDLTKQKPASPLTSYWDDL